MTTDGDAPATVSTDLLTEAELDAIVAEAKLLWAQALGANDNRLGLLDAVNVEVGNLQDNRLGAAIGGTVLIDSNAAGYGWFVDPTPWESGEFLAGNAPSGMDLLTVVMHELGHVLGLQDVSRPYSLMNDQLETGVRYLAVQPAVTTETSAPKSTLLNFRPPSNGIPAGWVFEDGSVSSSSDDDGWWARLRNWVTGGKTAHNALPTILLMKEIASAGSMEDGAKGIGKEVSAIVKAESKGDAGSSLGQGQNWASDFVLNAGKKADPNGKISIKI